MNKLLVLGSLGLNVLGLAASMRVIRSRGGLRYLRSLWNRDAASNPDPGVEFRTGLFALAEVPEGSRPIVFLGDSLTAEGTWVELFPASVPVLNRGIGGDTSVGVLARIGSITALNPRAVFLMIGTNDPQALRASPKFTGSTIRRIVKAIHKESPDTLVYIQMLVPTRHIGFSAWSREVNADLTNIGAHPNVFRIDFREQFEDADGLIDPALTRDGVHLTARGYEVWRDAIAPIVRGLQEAETESCAT